MNRAWRRLVAITCAATLSLGLATDPGALAVEEGARGLVQRLLPRLESSTPSIRRKAETELFRLGEDGFRELERMAQGRDPARSGLALRLLQGWDERPPAKFERQARARPRPGSGTAPAPASVGRELPALAGSVARTPAGRPVSARGSVVDGGDHFSWYLEHTGRNWVTIRREGGARARTYRSASVAALRSAQPDVAKRLERAALDHPKLREMLRRARGRRPAASGYR